jgi:hypothetical protein
MIWTVGSSIKQIPTTTNPEAVIFHPTSQDTIVLISSLEMQPTDPKHLFILRSIAEEYKNGTLQSTCFFDIPFLSDSSDERIKFDIRPIDYNGVYSVGWIFEQEADLGNVAHTCGLQPHDKDAFYHLMAYNIYNKKLSMRCFWGGAEHIDNLLVPTGEFCTESYVWADQMLTPVLDFYPNSSSRHFHYLFQAVMSLDQAPKEPIRYICAKNDSIKAENSRDEIGGQVDEENGLLSFFTYISEALSGEKPWDELTWCRTIRGDGKFLVLLAERGYAVLSIDEGIVLPSTHQLPVEFLTYQP